MNNFGVIEIASAKTTSAPGWAYVPDTGDLLPGANALQPANRKRARNAPGGVSVGDLSARQEAKVRKEIEALERDGGRDNSIPVPAKGSAGGGKAQGKHTPNVRKILQSQKTFSNHLDDFLAMQAQAEGVAATVSSSNLRPNAFSSSSSSSVNTTAKRPATKKDATSIATTTATTSTAAQDEDDTAMTMTMTTTTTTTENADQQQPRLILPPPCRPPPAAHPGDGDPLLVSRAPGMPPDEELRKLLAHPPLTYYEARGKWEDVAAAYPTRAFCEVCGYWGRVRCVKCGTRVCALDCLETHREECITRYGL